MLIVPLLIAFSGDGWWSRGRFDKSKIDGLEERLHSAKEHQSYRSQRLTDAQAEIAKLKQQIESGATPDLLRATVNSTARIVDEAATARILEGLSEAGWPSTWQ
jgi:phage terminase Nu1 subunit (DNA packaging protein)